MARQRRNEEAIAYMKKHLVQWQETHFEEIKRVSALFAFPPTTTCGPYKVRLVNTLSFTGMFADLCPLRGSTMLGAGQILFTSSALQYTTSIRFPTNHCSTSRFTPVWHRSNCQHALIRLQKTLTARCATGNRPLWAQQVIKMSL